MLAIFKKGVVEVPEELKSNAVPGDRGRRPHLLHQTLPAFLSSHHSADAFSVRIGDEALLAFAPPHNPIFIHHRLFGCVDDVYCIFLGGLNNLWALLKQYGLPRKTNEAMFVIEAYRVLRDRGPFPAHQAVKDMDGSFGFVVYDAGAATVFAALGSEEGVRLFWGVGEDGSVVISDSVDTIKARCAKSYAPFPAGCMFHSEGGLVSVEHPGKKMMALPRTDSEGVLCGANFKVDARARIGAAMPRVGSDANWPVWGPPV